mgnify:CR=1 FL=1
MALAPPYDKLPALIPLALQQIQKLINKIIAFLQKKVMEFVSKINKLPKNIKCDDHRIINLKQLLEKIKNTIDKILDVLRILLIIIPIATIVANIAAVAIQIQLLLPPIAIIPAVPATGQLVNIQNETIASVLGALKQASIVIAITTGTLTLVSGLLGPGINKLSSICQNDVFVVTSATQASIINDVKDQVNGLDTDTDDDILDRNLDLSTIDTSAYEQFINSEFYRPINVSNSDLAERDVIITDLLDRQKNLLENIIEAPSKSIVNNDINKSGIPPDNLGVSGDYYIDKTTKTLYGPKLADNSWGTGLNY